MSDITKIDLIRGQLYTWFEANTKKSDGSGSNACYWNLYKLRTMSSSITKATEKVAQNFSAEDIDDSIDLLFDNLKSLNYIKCVGIQLRRKQNDAHALHRNIENPYYEADLSAIAGAGSQKTHDAEFRFLMMEKFWADKIESVEREKQQALEQQKRDFERQNEIKELKEMLSTAQNNNKSSLEMIWEKLEQPLMMVLSNAMQQPQLPAEQIAEPSKDNNQQFFDNPMYNEALQLYPDFENMLSELCTIARFSPESQKQLRLSIHNVAKQIELQIKEQSKQKTNE